MGPWHLEGRRRGGKGGNGRREGEGVGGKCHSRLVPFGSTSTGKGSIMLMLPSFTLFSMVGVTNTCFPSTIACMRRSHRRSGRGGDKLPARRKGAPKCKLPLLCTLPTLTIITIIGPCRCDAHR